MLRAAVAYRVDRGLSPVLVGSDKRPTEADWPAVSARASLADIERKFSGARSLGLLCGDWSHVLTEPDPSRTWIVVIDADNHGPFIFDAGKHPADWARFAGLTGVEVFDLLQDEHGRLDTWLQFTPTGGRHYVCRHPGTSVRIPTRAHVWPGVDIRGDANGQIVCSPTVRPGVGAYTWEASSHPLETPLADLPAWLLEASGLKRAVHVGEAIGRAAESFLGRAFDIAGWLGADTRTGAVTVRCPWWHEHTDGVDAPHTSTVILPPTADRPLGSFHCSHGHCSRRGTIAALEALPEMAIVLAGNGDPAGLDLACSLLRKGAAA